MEPAIPSTASSQLWNLAAGAAQTWELRTQPRVAGALTFTNVFQSASATASASATVTVRPGGGELGLTGIRWRDGVRW